MELWFDLYHGYANFKMVDSFELVIPAIIIIIICLTS